MAAIGHALVNLPPNERPPIVIPPLAGTEPAVVGTPPVNFGENDVFPTSAVLDAAGNIDGSAESAVDGNFYNALKRVRLIGNRASALYTQSYNFRIRVMERIQAIRSLIYFMRAVVSNIENALQTGMTPADAARQAAEDVREALRTERTAVTDALAPLNMDLLGAIVELLEAPGLSPDDIITALENAIAAWTEELERLVREPTLDANGAVVAGTPPAGVLHQAHPNAVGPAPANPPGPAAEAAEWLASYPPPGPAPGENIGAALAPQLPVPGPGTPTATPNLVAPPAAYDAANPGGNYGVQGGGWTPQGVRKKKQKHRKTRRKRKRRKRKKKKKTRHRRRRKKVRMTRRRKRGGFFKKIIRSL